jgi:hypothetical protein
VWRSITYSVYDVRYNVGILVIRLTREFGVHFVFVSDMLGTLNHRNPGSYLTMHDFVLFSVSVAQGLTEGPQEVAKRIVTATGISSAYKDKIAEFLGLCEWKTHQGLIPKGLDIVRVFREEIQDRDLSAADVSEIIKHIAPSYTLPMDFRFYCQKLRPTDTMMLLVSNSDINQVNRLSLGKSGELLTFSHILSMYANARLELAVCASMNCDFVSDGINRSIVDRRISELIHKASRNLEEMHLFEERVLGTSKAVADAIDHGGRGLDEFLTVLSESSRFKKFLSKADSEAGLVDQYISEVSARSWIDRLPGKSLRFVFFQAAAVTAGLMLSPLEGVASSVGASLLDTFLLDKVVKKWRPNQFVDDVLKPYASVSKTS